MWLKLGLVGLVLTVGAIMVTLMVFGRLDAPPPITEAELRERQQSNASEPTSPPWTAADEAARAGDFITAIGLLEEWLQTQPALDAAVARRAQEQLAQWQTMASGQGS